MRKKKEEGFEGGLLRKQKKNEKVRKGKGKRRERCQIWSMHILETNKKQEQRVHIIQYNTIQQKWIGF